MRMSSGIVDARQRIGPLPDRPDFVTLGERALPTVGAARIYVCGITPYDVTHVGHAATFVWADVLAAVLGSTAIQATVCRNITDVDDVLIDAARAKGRYYDEFALSQEAIFDHSMTALQVAAPAAQPRARHYTDAVQQLAQALLDNGAAYERDGSVWFRGHEVPDFAGTRAMTHSGSPPPTATTRATAPRTTPSTCRSGSPRPTEPQRGRAPGAGAGPGGTRSAPPWRWPSTVPRSTSWSGERT